MYSAPADFLFYQNIFIPSRIHWDAHVFKKKKKKKRKTKKIIEKKTITKGVQYVYAMMSVNKRSRS